jgi:hypothetical protein
MPARHATLYARMLASDPTWDGRFFVGVLTSGLQRLLDLETRPDALATRRLLLPFAPWRSLVTLHLWQLKP